MSTGTGNRTAGLARQLILLTVLPLLLMSPRADASLGNRLDAFVPEAGQAIAVSGSTAYLGSQGSEDISQIDLATHAKIGSIDPSGKAPQGFSAFTADSSGGLWAAEAAARGQIYRMDVVTESMDSVFSAQELGSTSESVDGLAVDADGTLWLKGTSTSAHLSVIYHIQLLHEVTGYAYKVIGAFTVPFESTGLAVDGQDLWLADTSAGKIRQYDKAGEPLPGAVFDVGELNGQAVRPDGLALDYCTFPGKLAIWAYGAGGTSGQLVAYEIGPGATSPKCPLPRSEEPAIAGAWTFPVVSQAPPRASIGAPRLRALAQDNGARAGSPVLLEGFVPGDRKGHRFTYTWDLGDGIKRAGPGRLSHIYRCAGIYTISVTATAASGAAHTTVGTLTVGFPRSTGRSYRGVRVSPRVRLEGHDAVAWLSWSGHQRPAAARWVSWGLDRRHTARASIRTNVTTLKGDHRLSAVAHFGKGQTVAIKACFYV